MHPGGKIDYDVPAKLVGTPPASARGLQIGDGTLAEMVRLGVERMREGYINVRITTPDGSLRMEEIDAVLARADFPK